MQLLEVRGAVRPIYESLGVKRLITKASTFSIFCCTMQMSGRTQLYLRLCSPCVCLLIKGSSSRLALDTVCFPSDTTDLRTAWQFLPVRLFHKRLNPTLSHCITYFSFSLQGSLSSCLASNFMDGYIYLGKITFFILHFSGCIVLESVITALKT